MKSRARWWWLVPVFCWAAFGQQFPQFVSEKIAAGYRFTEGAAWSKDGFLVFSDTPNNRLLKWVPGRQAEVLREHANGPSGNAFDAQGRLYTAETRARRVTRTDKSGAIEVLAERWEDKRLNAPAGIAVSKSGHVYFTDPAFGYQADQRELNFYGVYHIPPKGPMQLVARPKGRPHGVALSPNSRTLYVSNTDEHNIRAYDLDRNGEASNERVLISGIAGVPGGMSVDEKGNLWVAGKGMAIYSPQGQLLHTIEMQDPASSCALDESSGSPFLFVTARGFVYRMRPADP
ncbi:MAG: SMP-30/gluconolactonase/LRE family protein [Acidobacteriia bacterium]|nr:SMP-30/gluconolactonase/LRE family protein [Terriglobia bacterium]